MATPIPVKEEKGDDKKNVVFPPDPQPAANAQLNSLFNFGGPQPVYIVKAPAGALVPVKPEEKKEPPLTPIAKDYQPLARLLVGALGLAEEGQVFTPTKGQGTDWTTYINPKFHAEITYALADIKKYLRPSPDGKSDYSLLNIGEHEEGRAHFGALVQYHESNKKLSLNGTYRQKNVDGYLEERYQSAIWFFKTHSGSF